MCQGRGEFYMTLKPESLEKKSDTKLRKVAIFPLKTDADYTSKTLEANY